MGYHRAGFEVIGVDHKPQPHYPFEFHQADALGFPLEGFDAIHASPPCQFYSRTEHRKRQGIVYPALIEPTQQAVRAAGVLYVIENVETAWPALWLPVLLCGGMFGLGVTRHRLFEANWPLSAPLHTCNGKLVDRDQVSVTRHGPPARWYRKHPGAHFNIETWHHAMGIDWMPRGRLTEAIPPAYTEWIGRQLMSIISSAGGDAASA